MHVRSLIASTAPNAWIERRRKLFWSLNKSKMRTNSPSSFRMNPTGKKNYDAISETSRENRVNEDPHLITDFFDGWAVRPLLSGVKVLRQISKTLLTMNQKRQAEVFGIGMDAHHSSQHSQVLILVEVTSSLPCRGFFVNLGDELVMESMEEEAKVFNSISHDKSQPYSHHRTADHSKRQRLSSQARWITSSRYQLS